MDQKLKCVMLVDDDRLTNFVNMIMIDKAGITDRIERCPSVQSAVKYLGSSANMFPEVPCPDLILLDIQMPELSGWKFMGEYETIKDQLVRQPVIIILSALLDAEATLYATNFPELTALYSKPLTPEMLNGIMTLYFNSN